LGEGLRVIQDVARRELLYFLGAPLVLMATGMGPGACAIIGIFAVTVWVIARGMHDSFGFSGKK
jgi:hypothetical protein